MKDKLILNKRRLRRKKEKRSFKKMKKIKKRYSAKKILNKLQKKLKT